MSVSKKLGTDTIKELHQATLLDQLKDELDDKHPDPDQVENAFVLFLKCSKSWL